MERKISTSFDYRFTPQTSRAGHQSSVHCFWLKYARSIENCNNQNVCNLLHFFFLQVDFRLFYSGKHLVQLFDKELLLWNEKKGISKSKVSKIRYCWIHNSHFLCAKLCTFFCLVTKVSSRIIYRQPLYNIRFANCMQVHKLSRTHTRDSRTLGVIVMWASGESCSCHWHCAAAWRRRRRRRWRLAGWSDGWHVARPECVCESERMCLCVLTV